MEVNGSRAILPPVTGFASSDNLTVGVAMTLLTAAEAARLLRLSERSLERLRCSGFGPKFVKLKRRVLYQQSDLDDWIALRVVSSTSEATAQR